MLEPGPSCPSLSSFLFNHILSYWYLEITGGRSDIYITETGKCCNLGLFRFVSLSWFVYQHTTGCGSLVGLVGRCVYSGVVCVCVGGVVFLKENFQEPVICFSETIKSSLYFDNSCVCVMEAIQE